MIAPAPDPLVQPPQTKLSSGRTRAASVKGKSPGGLANYAAADGAATRCLFAVQNFTINFEMDFERPKVECVMLARAAADPAARRV
jgi:hypothetical protein